jgi:hypothetical protein
LFAKISKIARFILLVLFFAIGLLYVLFKSQPVQTWLVKKATVFLSKELGTQVKIGSVDIEFFKTAVLEDIYIGDQHADTLLYFTKLKVDYHTYDKDKHLIKLNYLGMEGGKILLGEHRGDTVDNYEFLIDYFSGGPRDPNKPKVVWTVYAAKVTMDDIRFDYFNRNEPKPDFMDFNYNDMSFSQIHADFRDFYLIDDSMHFDARHMETKEKCGLVVTHISADTKIHEGGIEFRDMNMLTPYSDLKDLFIMETKDWKDYNDFNTKVKLKANLVDSKIDTRDLEFFSYAIKDYKTVIYATGTGEGFLEKLKGKNTTLKLYDNTVYKGDWSMTGLPDFDNTVLDFDVREFRTDYKDLNKLSQNNIPGNFMQLGTISYQGKFAGFYNDFITFGKVKTRLGDFDADMNIKFKEGLDKAVYSGKLKTALFRLSDFVEGAPIDDVAFDLDIKGKGLSRETYDMEVSGVVPQLKFMDYTYHDITASGRMKPGSFTGKAMVRDKNLNLDFNGEFLTGGRIPEARFTATVFYANLATLGFDTTRQNVSGTFTMNFTGHNLDDANGSIMGENIQVSRNGETVSLPYVSLVASDIEEGRELNLKSDIVDASIKGRFSLDKIDVSVLHLMHQLIPAYFSKPAIDLPNEDFVFDFELKKPSAITALYMPNLYIHPSHGKGFYRSASQELSFRFDNDSIRYDDYVVKGLTMDAKKSRDSILKLDIHMNTFTDYSYIKANDIDIHTSAFENIIEYDINGVDTGFKIAVGSKGRLLFVEDTISLEVSQANLVINNDNWKLDKNSSTRFTNDKFLLENIILRNKDQFLSLNGQFGNGSSNEMKLNVKQFSLEAINYFTRGAIPSVNGVSDGDISYRVVEKQALYESNLMVRNFQLGEDTIGDLSINTNNKANSSLQHLSVYVQRGLLDSLRIEGDINYKSKSNNLNLWASMPQSEIRVFEPFLKGMMSNMKGTIRTKDSIHISGQFDEPVVKGELVIEDAEVQVDYLKATLKFSAVVQTDRNKISILPFTFYDDKNNIGRAKGYVFHKGFKDYSLNLTLWELKNFHALNTSRSDNELFYGQAYVTGNASFSGPFDNLDIRINVKTMQGTNIALPISDGDASALPSYIHFKTTKKRVIKKEEDFPIRSLVMDIEATTDAEIDIIFDEIMNERITGTGHGNIRMEMNKTADFYMFGTYTVESGKYLFTAFDFYNKEFFVRPGGTISWYGDPLDAKLNLGAYHTETASPKPLLTAQVNSTSTQSTAVQPITVESELYIKGNLFSPEISFGLNFPKIRSEYPNANIELVPVITRIKADKEETARQVFSLLLMNQFLTPTFSQNSSDLSNAGSSALSNAGTDLLSAQLSNWLNKIDPSWQVNIIYKNGNLTLPNEYGLTLGRKFLDDKLVVDGGVSNYSNRPNIQVEYQVTRKGNIKVKAYTRSSFNTVNTASLSTPITTNGVGVVFTTEFNRFLRRKNKAKKIELPKDDSTNQNDTPLSQGRVVPFDGIGQPEENAARFRETDAPAGRLNARRDEE